MMPWINAAINLTLGDMAMRKPAGELNILEVKERAEWRRWLKKNFKTAKDVWLVAYKKGSGKTRIPYNDAVEEALCFGWIDSNIRSLDERRYAQRFSPRRPNSSYSPANLERLRGLVAKGKVEKSVLAALPPLKQAKEPRLVVAKDILAAIKANKEAWANYRQLSSAYKRIRIGFIEGARNRPAEFKKRLAYFIKMTAKNKMFGYGGIEKYY
jgi:uncharacterized protein YdeI (YjbR/CyaY-like superfamily)